MISPSVDASSARSICAARCTSSPTPAPSPRSWTDEDSGGALYEERALAFDEYEKAAAHALRRLRIDRRSA
jgi:hypothetical protein